MNSKEVTIIPFKDNMNSELCSLKKLPDITFNLVNSNPDLNVPEIKIIDQKPIIIDLTVTTSNSNKTKNKKHKQIKNVPEISKLNIKNLSNNIAPEVILEKNALLKKHNINKKIDQKLIIIDLTKTDSNSEIIKSQNHKQINNITKARNNTKKILKKNPKFVSKKCINTEKENIILDNKNKGKTKSFNLENLKTSKPKKKKLNTSDSQEVKYILNNNSIINNTSAIQIDNYPDNKEYTCLDLSINSQFHIAPTFHSLDFINDVIPEYDKFIMGITKSSETRNSTNCIFKNTSKTETNLNFYNEISPQINKKNYTTNMTTAELKDKEFLQILRSTYIDKLINIQNFLENK